MEEQNKEKKSIGDKVFAVAIRVGLVAIPLVAIFGTCFRILRGDPLSEVGMIPCFLMCFTSGILSFKISGQGGVRDYFSAVFKGISVFLFIVLGIAIASVIKGA
jgi:hypothetical protein